MTRHPISDTCPCLDCITYGKTTCPKTVAGTVKRCALREGHAGPCISIAPYLGMLAKDVVRAAREWRARVFG